MAVQSRGSLGSGTRLPNLPDSGNNYEFASHALELRRKRRKQILIRCFHHQGKLTDQRDLEEAIPSFISRKSLYE